MSLQVVKLTLNAGKMAFVVLKKYPAALVALMKLNVSHMHKKEKHVEEKFFIALHPTVVLDLDVNTTNLLLIFQAFVFQIVEMVQLTVAHHNVEEIFTQQHL